MDERQEDNYEAETDHTEVEIDNPNNSGRNPVVAIAVVVLLALLAYGLYVFINREKPSEAPVTPVETQNSADNAVEGSEESVPVEEPVIEAETETDVQVEVPATQAE